MLTRLELTDAQLAELTAMCEDAERIDATTRVLVGERCLGLAMFETLDAFDWGGAIARHVYTLSGFSADDRSHYLSVMRSTVEASQLPLAERGGVEREQLDKIGFPNPGSPSDRLFSTVFAFRRISSRFALVWGNVVPSDFRRYARLRTARTVLAVERFRLKHGKLPGALSELSPGFLKSVPLDPFDNKPLRYKKLEKGYAVWSIGEHGDDGGEIKDLETLIPGHDVIFRIKR